MVKRSTWIILGVFGVLLVAVFALPRLGIEPTPTEDPFGTLPEAGPLLFDVIATDMVEVRITAQDGRALRVERVDEFQWQMLAPVEAGPEEVDIFALQSVLFGLMGLESTPLDEEITDLAAVGLDPPAYIIVIKLADGTQRSVQVGNLNGLGTDYFARRPEQPVLLVDALTLDSILQLLENPPLAPTALPGEDIPTP
jgi:hypothetical protein